MMIKMIGNRFIIKGNQRSRLSLNDAIYLLIYLDSKNVKKKRPPSTSLNAVKDVIFVFPFVSYNYDLIVNFGN